MGKLSVYEFRYNRRPEVRARNRERMRIRWHTDEEYRQRQLERLRNYVRRRPLRVEIPAPYSGHRWLEMARQAVTRDGMVDTSAPWAEDRYDEMGEALLALLEGRDMHEAVKQYRKREYVPRYLTTHWDDFKDDEGNSYADIVLPREPSAEEEAITRETIRVRVPSRFYRKGATSRHMRHKTQQPHRRRTKDGKSWQKHIARSA